MNNSGAGGTAGACRRSVGRSVDVGGRTLNVFCSGEGSPAVILEAASGLGYFWSDVQPEIARFSHTCWYDRAGIGWSDPGPFPRTSVAIANDLRELPRRIGIAPPYVLVGNAFGGMSMRVYGRLYPSDVAGMVLVDSAHEDEPKRALKAFLARTAPRYLWYPLPLGFQTIVENGLVRMTGPPRAPAGEASSITRAQIIEMLSRAPQTQATQWTTGAVSAQSCEEARAVTSLGDCPLIVLTAGKPPVFDDVDLQLAGNCQRASTPRAWKRKA